MCSSDLSFDTSKVKNKKTKAGTPEEIAAWMDSPLDLKSLVKEEDYEEGAKIVAYLESTLNTPVKVESAATAPKGEKPPFDADADDDDDAKFKKGINA